MNLHNAEHALLTFLLDVKLRFGGDITAKVREEAGTLHTRQVVTLNIGNDMVYLSVLTHSKWIEGPMVEIIYDDTDFRFDDDVEQTITDVKDYMIASGYHFS